MTPVAINTNCADLVEIFAPRLRYSPCREPDFEFVLGLAALSLESQFWISHRSTRLRASDPDHKQLEYRCDSNSLLSCSHTIQCPGVAFVREVRCHVARVGVASERVSPFSFRLLGAIAIPDTAEK